MDQDRHQPSETSTTRENHLSVVMNVRAGTVRIMSDAQRASAAAGSMRAAMREAQERSGVRLLTTAA
jgi:hypothetical protein